MEPTVTRKDRDMLLIYLGTVKLIEVTVNYRYNSNNSRRPRNLAVYMRVIHPSGRSSVGEHMSVLTAGTFLASMGLDLCEFYQLVKENGWSSDNSELKKQIGMAL